MKMEGNQTVNGCGFEGGHVGFFLFVTFHLPFFFFLLSASFSFSSAHKRKAQIRLIQFFYNCLKKIIISVSNFQTMWWKFNGI